MSEPIKEQEEGVSTPGNQPKPGKAKKIENPKGYWKIQSQGFLFLELSLGLILYPGAYAYITQEQKDQLPPHAINMVQFAEVDADEYNAKIGKQGLLGLG